MASAAPIAPIFSGRVEHALDSKNRVTMPSRWRRTDSDEFFLMPDRTNTFLRAMPPAQFQEVTDKLQSNPALTAKDLAVFMRRFYSSAVQVFTDKQGRMLIPEDFCALLELRGEITFVGVRDTFEIWNTRRWEKAQTQEESAFDRVAELAGL